MHGTVTLESSGGGCRRRLSLTARRCCPLCCCLLICCRRLVALRRSLLHSLCRRWHCMLSLLAFLACLPLQLLHEGREPCCLHVVMGRGSTCVLRGHERASASHYPAPCTLQQQRRHHPGRLAWGLAAAAPPWPRWQEQAVQLPLSPSLTHPPLFLQNPRHQGLRNGALPSADALLVLALNEVQQLLHLCKTTMKSGMKMQG